jgi:hypothetical protein
MTCNACECVVEPVDVDEPDDEGWFSEEWECVNGHKGYIRGREEENPKNWTKYGAIYE